MDLSSSSPTKENEAPADGKEGGGTLPSRTPTLSWQRRPTSRGGPGSRPLSMVAAQNATQRSLAGSQEPQSAGPGETSFSREQIAQSLGSKDPAWFRQTADRGQKSAAYRKNQVEDEDRSDVSSSSARLPGMSATTSRPESPPPQTASTGTPTQGLRLASPLPLNPSGGNDDQSENTSSLSEQLAKPALDRTATRSTSPTKGMGGFVQSAMMKRSDSVKRWSVQSPPGLARADSVASMRPPPHGRDLPQPPKPQTTTRVGSTTPTSSRPTSKHGDSRFGDDSTLTESVRSPTEERDEEHTPIPTSPSKTMDPRRWSPTKSSWLDSALNKPESPKPQQKPHAPAQPAWMVQLNKNKADRATNPEPTERDKRAGSISHKHQVSIGGLMRSSPMGAAAKNNTPGLGGVYSPPVSGNRPPLNLATKPTETRETIEERLSKQNDETTEAAEPENAGISQLDNDARQTVTSPPPLKPKPKPETPPKKDLRASLKQRPANGESTRTDEPEFKNVFGNLRRTKTQNYVAPDELKSNITRGKAALNVTGGPQKTERKDEFKDAILKKKDQFKQTQAEGKGVTRTSSIDEEKPVPEGLPRRAELGRTLTGSRRDPPPATQQPVSQVRKTSSPKPTPGPKRMPSQTFSPISPSTNAEPTQTSPPLEPAKRVNTLPEASSTTALPRALPRLQKETSAPSQLQGRAAGGKLSERFNPALAGILARGPPPLAAEGGKSSTAAAPAVDTSEPSKPGPQLTHMTKGRARGPRRKAPTSAAPSAEKAQESSSAALVSKSTVKTPRPAIQTKSVTTTPQRERPSPSPKPRNFSGTKVEDISAVEPIKPSAPSIQEQVASRAALRTKPAPIKPLAQKEAVEGRSLPFRRRPSSPEKPFAEPVSPIKPHKTGGDVSQPGSPKKLDVKRMSRFLDDSSTTKSDAPKEPVRLFHQRTGSRSPVKSFERPLPEPVSTPKPESKPLSVTGPASSKFGSAAPKSPSPSPGPKPSFKALGSPALGAAGGPAPSLSTPTRALPQTPGSGVKSPSVASPMPSPTKQASELQVVLTDFFGPQRPVKEHKVDVARIITERPQVGAKVNSLNYQMFQISGDGKKMPLQPHHERTLFEQEMYVCAHEFEDETGKNGFEIYFWVGDEVTESEAEDAQLFASKEARSVGGKLIKLRQGRESTRFLQALGGTVITRRGSSNKYDSLAPSMLCGRRYLGQVVFDEVDFAAGSLCAGFPYLIGQGGKCYLWKGKGSTVDELSCARLVGMESSMTGELIEYEEGAEPASFWEVFGPGPKPHSADHWKLKPNFDKYSGRLFCSDADSRQQVCQLSTLVPEGHSTNTTLDLRNLTLQPGGPLPVQHLRPGRLLRALHRRRRPRPVAVRLLPPRPELCAGLHHPRRVHRGPAVRARQHRRPRGRSAGPQAGLPQVVRREEPYNDERAWAGAQEGEEPKGCAVDAGVAGSEGLSCVFLFGSPCFKDFSSCTSFYIWGVLDARDGKGEALGVVFSTMELGGLKKGICLRCTRKGVDGLDERTYTYIHHM